MFRAEAKIGTKIVFLCTQNFSSLVSNKRVRPANQSYVILNIADVAFIEIELAHAVAKPSGRRSILETFVHANV